MDAGGVALVGAVAAVLGATVGAGGAVRAAKSQNRGQHVQWRRQVRRDAFAAFLTAINDCHDKILALCANVGRAPTPESAATFAVEVRDLAAVLKQCQDCYNIVRLEGPAEVSSRAEALMELLSQWSAVALQQVEPEIMGLTRVEMERRRLPTSDSLNFPDDAVSQMRMAKTQINDFAEAARRALDHPDGALDRR
ncbi:hypothetical protein ABZ916_20145 [Streptomyces sp. NPDC046853]|uniref:hypothetical protein n=1 Tax=Streptomyces sp. NPDC046853 TaxID=3154920 RepID=UPI0033EC1A82